MKTIVHISLVLIILLSASVYAAKPKKQKKSAAESKNAVVEVNKPAEEPNKPVAETTAPASEPNLIKDANQTAGAAVVTVNGTAITEAQVEQAIAPRMQQMAGRVPENMIPQYRLQIRKRVIDQLVLEELITQEEKKNNIDVNKAEMDEQINKQIAQQNLTIDEFKSLLRAYGVTFADYQQNVRLKLMFDKLMESQFAGKVQQPTDEQLKAYYDDNIQQFHKPEAIHAKHILIVPAKDTNDPEKAKAVAKAKAQDILKKIKAGGNFEELAKQYSDCPSGKNGGDLDVQAKGNLVPEFEKAAYALKPGQVSDVVETSFGYHIIKLVSHIDANTVSFEQAKGDIKEALTAKEKEQIAMDYVQKIREAADIKYTNEEDKFELAIPGTKPAPPSRKQTEEPKPSEEKKPELNKDKSEKE